MILASSRADQVRSGQQGSKEKARDSELVVKLVKMKGSMMTMTEMVETQLPVKIKVFRHF